MSAAEPPVQHQSLSAYLGQVQQAIRAAMPGEDWIVAELTDFKRRPNGHVYFDVLEARDGREVAKARCTLFSTAAAKVIAEWERVTGGLPQAGMSVLIRARAEFSPQYGFSLVVTAIDPAYTLGNMQAKVQQIIASLKARGWFDLQRALEAPRGYWRVAVVAPHEAAGLADFRRDAEQMAGAGVCDFEIFSATFQGRDAPESICTALLQVHERHKLSAFDAVCIIRGGGAKADLAWLNDGKLAAWVCRLPIPVYTGIGHKIDECVLDLVAHRRFDTPSKVIGFIRTSLMAEAAALRGLMERGDAHILRLVAAQAPALDRAWAGFSQKAREMLHGQQRALLQSGSRFDSGCSRLSSQQRMALQSAQALFSRLGVGLCASGHRNTLLTASRAASLAQALLAREQSRLALAGTLYDKTNPLALLDRGFALVRNEAGQVVASADQARQAGTLALTFADGQVITRVQ